MSLHQKKADIFALTWMMINISGRISEVGWMIDVHGSSLRLSERKNEHDAAMSLNFSEEQFAYLRRRIGPFLGGAARHIHVCNSLATVGLASNPIQLLYSNCFWLKQLPHLRARKNTFCLCLDLNHRWA